MGGRGGAGGRRCGGFLGRHAEEQGKQEVVSARIRGNDETSFAGMGDILRESAGGMRLECDPRKAALRRDCETEESK